MLFKARVRLDILGEEPICMLFKARVRLDILGEGADLHAFQGLSSTQDVQVGVPPTSTSVSPLSLRERARVRGF